MLSLWTCTASHGSQLVDIFRTAKVEHDRLLCVAHGTAFVTTIVVYYFLNWCWVFVIHLVSALDVEIGYAPAPNFTVFDRHFRPS